jgi:Rap1a immunity proteins
LSHSRWPRPRSFPHTQCFPRTVGTTSTKFCSSRLGSFESGMCFGLVTAYFESLHMRFVCKAENDSITPRQLVDIVMKFYNDYPNRRHQPAMIGASAALLRAFECRKSQKQGETASVFLSISIRNLRRYVSRCKSIGTRGISVDVRRLRSGFDRSCSAARAYTRSDERSDLAWQVRAQKGADDRDPRSISISIPLSKFHFLMRPRLHAQSAPIRRLASSNSSTLDFVMASPTR